MLLRAVVFFSLLAFLSLQSGAVYGLVSECEGVVAPSSRPIVCLIVNIASDYYKQFQWTGGDSGEHICPYFLFLNVYRSRKEKR